MAWLALARAGRVASWAINHVGRTCVGRQVVNPHWLLLCDIVLRTEDGVFHCRRRTADFGQASSLYEQDHRGLFDLRAGVFVDVGANIGRYTVMVARQLGPRGTVLALEPEPGNFAALCRNVKANGLDNVIVRQVACSNANAPVRLVRHRWEAGLDTTRVLDSGEFARRGFGDTIEVEGRTLDSLLHELGITAIDLLKIDVEGAELAVLEGAADALASSPSVRVVVEAWSDEPGRFLADRGFGLRHIRKSDCNVDFVAEWPAARSRPAAVLAPSRVSLGVTTVTASQAARDSERTIRARAPVAGGAVQLVKSLLRPALRRALRRSETLSALYAGVKGRIEEWDSARWLRFYQAEAARRGLTVPARDDLRRRVAERLASRGIRPVPNAMGNLHVFAADRFAPFDETMDFLVSLKKFGLVSVFSWGDYGFDHYSKKWLWERDRMNEAMLATFRRAHADQPVDVVIGCLSGYTTSPDTVAEMGRMGAAVVNICLDDMTTFPGPWVGGRWYSAAALANSVDLTLTNAPPSVIKYYVHGGLAMFWPQGALPEIHRPYDVPFEYGVSFCGYRYPRRARQVSALRRAGIAVATFGTGWEHGPLPQEEMVKLWSRSRVNLGFATAANTRNITNLKGRDFQVPSAGGLYLTQRTPDLPVVYEVGKEIIVYENTADCVEKIHWLLSHPEEADRIRQAGRGRAIRDHTWDRRFSDVFELIGVL